MIDISKIMNEESNPIKDEFSEKEMISSCNNIVIPRFFNLHLEPLIETQERYSESTRTNWSKLLSDVNQNKEQLSDIIRGAYGIPKMGMDEQYLNMNTNTITLANGDISEVNKDCVMVWTGCPTIKQLSNLVNVWKETLPQSKYHIEQISGTDSNGKKLLSNREVEDYIKYTLIPKVKKQGKKLVLISKYVGARSFSVSEIATEFLWYDGGGIEATKQKISRVLTGGKMWNGDKKIYGNVVSFSFDPNREETSPIDEYLLSESEQVENSELSDSITRVLRSAQIFKQDEYGLIIQFTQDDEETYSSKLVNSSSLLKVAEAGVNPHMIDENDKDVDFVEIDKNEFESEIKKSFKELDIKKSVSNKEKKEKTTKEKSEELTSYIKRKKVLQTIVKRVIELSEINNLESDNMIEMLDMIYQKGFDSEVEYEVGVGTRTIKRWANQGAFNEKLMNTIITNYNISEKKYEEIFG
jgi:hypothetical protein|tara:strand:+ start:957 stop:2363 length:1407 start_codon:yes stop_codon:yes gene_type:complete